MSYIILLFEFTYLGKFIYLGADLSLVLLVSGCVFKDRVLKVLRVEPHCLFQLAYRFIDGVCVCGAERVRLADQLLIFNHLQLLVELQLFLLGL